jgi:hypothetical protein
MYNLLNISVMNKNIEGLIKASSEQILRMLRHLFVFIPISIPWIAYTLSFIPPPPSSIYIEGVGYEKERICIWGWRAAEDKGVPGCRLEPPNHPNGGSKRCG